MRVPLVSDPHARGKLLQPIGGPTETWNLFRLWTPLSYEPTIRWVCLFGRVTASGRCLAAAFTTALSRLLFSTFDSGLDSQALQTFHSRNRERQVPYA